MQALLSSATRISKLLERSTVISKTKFPYISGLLAFREVPALIRGLG